MLDVTLSTETWNNAEGFIIDSYLPSFLSLHAIQTYTRMTSFASIPFFSCHGFVPLFDFNRQTFDVGFMVMYMYLWQWGDSSNGRSSYEGGGAG